MSGKNTRSGKGASHLSSTAQLMLAAKKQVGIHLASHQLKTRTTFHLLCIKCQTCFCQTFNERFDKFEQSIRNILAAQRELTERLTTTESQAAGHEQRFRAVETSVTELQQENKRLRAKLSDL